MMSVCVLLWNKQSCHDYYFEKLEGYNHSEFLLKNLCSTDTILPYEQNSKAVAELLMSQVTCFTSLECCYYAYNF